MSKELLRQLLNLDSEIKTRNVNLSDNIQDNNISSILLNIFKRSRHGDDIDDTSNSYDSFFDKNQNEVNESEDESEDESGESNSESILDDSEDESSLDDSEDESSLDDSEDESSLESGENYNIPRHISELVYLQSEY